MRIIRAVFYTLLGWAIGLPTAFAMLCRYQKAAGVEHPFFCDSPLWFTILTAIVIVPLSLYGDFIIGRWAWSKSKVWASIFAAAGIGLVLLTR